MEKNRIIEIATDVKNKSNKDLTTASEKLYNEFEKTKTLIIDLTRHLESIEKLYNDVNSEIQKRIKK
jgi:hypothetical protein